MEKPIYVKVCIIDDQVNFVEIAPPYAGTLFGVTNAVANLCGFMAPYAVGVLVKGNVSLTR